MRKGREGICTYMCPCVFDVVDVVTPMVCVKRKWKAVIYRID